MPAVPLALPATFTLAAAVGARTLATKGVLLTRLSSLNEAAMVDALCCDKTGTLTQNELVVSAIRPVKRGYNESDVLGFAALASSREGQDPIDSVIRATASNCKGLGRASRRSIPRSKWPRRSPSTRVAKFVWSRALRRSSQQLRL